MVEEKLVFTLGDKLRLYYDAAIAIYFVGTKPKSKKNGQRKKCIYVDLKRNMKSFGEYHVMSRSNVTLKLKKVVEHYYSQVYRKIHRKLEKHISNNVGINNWKSSRQLNKQWKAMAVPKTSWLLSSLLITLVLFTDKTHSLGTSFNKFTCYSAEQKYLMLLCYNI